MASKIVFLCAFAFLAQSITGQLCYQPLPWPAPPSCGCNSDSVSINFSEGGQSCYQPLPVPFPAPALLPLPRPIQPSCGCNSESVSITLSEGAQYRPQPIPLPTPVPSCSSNRVSIGISEGSGSYYRSAISAPSVSIAVPDNGGAFATTSIGPIAPSGIAVATDLGLSGDLLLSGALPYLSAVAFEGQFATSGAAPVSYGCGNGVIAVNEQIGGSVNAGAGSVSISRVGGGSCGCGCY